MSGTLLQKQPGVPEGVSRTGEVHPGQRVSSVQVVWVRQMNALPLGVFAFGWERPIQDFSCTVSSWANLWGLGTIPHFTDEEIQVGFDEQLATLTQPVVSSPEVCAINQRS